MFSKNESISFRSNNYLNFAYNMNPESLEGTRNANYLRENIFFPNPYIAF